MAKSKLKVALDRFKERDYAAEKEKKKRKLANKRKQGKKDQIIAEDSDSGDESDETEEIPDLVDADTVLEDATTKKSKPTSFKRQDDDEDMEGADVSEDEDNEEEEEDEEEDDEDEDGSDIDLSDIEHESDLAIPDIIPHQRLTINNKAALDAALARISLPFSSMPFSEHLQHTSAEPVEIPDIDDDLKRELTFYSQALQAAKFARKALQKEGVPFSRPMDYFAEMIKSDEHMGKVKAKLVDEAADKKASAEARKLRDLKKFGKQVQMAKLQEREKAKRETLDKIQALKRKRQSGDTNLTTEEDMFDVALEDAAKDTKRGRGGKGDGHNSKRQKRDEKFGYGGKKRGLKKNDALSSGDVSGFSSKANKARSFGVGARSGKTKAKRPGKNVRQAKR